MSQISQAGAPASNQFGEFQVHYPSEKQVKYLKSLVAQRVHPADPGFADYLAALENGTLNLKAASRMIDGLLAMPVKPSQASAVRMATSKQFEFIKSLIASKDTSQVEDLVQMGREAAMAGTMTAEQASKMIDMLKAQPRKPEPSVELESGMYKVGETIYKVYKTVHGSGKMCAKELVMVEGWSFETHGKQAAEFVYRGLATRFVKPENRMSLEQAKEFGVIYGVCCVCGATLTDETSIAAGIGPVCGKRFS